LGGGGGGRTEICAVQVEIKEFHTFIASLYRAPSRDFYQFFFRNMNLGIGESYVPQSTPSFTSL